MYYNLDVIISVGYRVKSKRGIAFRKWATQILKEYAVKGYAINQSKIDYDKYMKVLKLLENTTTQLEATEILNILEQYTLGLQLLDDYDHQRISKPKGENSIYQLTYEDCLVLIEEMKKNHKSDVFAIERAGIFKSSITIIFQTFDKVELYPTLEEKAAHLLYFL
jgi:Virulence protein